MGMKCSGYKALMREFIEGGLSREDNEMVSKHISSCDSCSEYYREMNDLIQDIKSLAKQQENIGIQQPEAFKAKVYAEIAKQGHIQKKRNFSIRLSFISMAAGVILAVYFFQSGNLYKFCSNKEPVHNLNSKPPDDNLPEYARTEPSVTVMVQADKNEWHAIETISPQQTVGKPVKPLETEEVQKPYMKTEVAGDIKKDIELNLFFKYKGQKTPDLASTGNNAIRFTTVILPDGKTERRYATYGTPNVTVNDKNLNYNEAVKTIKLLIENEQGTVTYYKKDYVLADVPETNIDSLYSKMKDYGEIQRIAPLSPENTSKLDSDNDKKISLKIKFKVLD